MSAYGAYNHPDMGRLLNDLAIWADLVIAANTVYPDGVIVSWQDADERGMPMVQRCYFKEGRELAFQAAPAGVPEKTKEQLILEWRAVTSQLRTGAH